MFFEFPFDFKKIRSVGVSRLFLVSPRHFRKNVFDFEKKHTADHGVWLNRPPEDTDRPLQ